jgi:hypothetical protein
MRIKYEVFMVTGWQNNVVIDEADTEEEALELLAKRIKDVGGGYPTLELTIRKIWTNSKKL